MQHLRLTEHAPTEAVSLNVAQVAALKRLVPDLVISPSGAAPGRYDVTPGSYVGVIRTSDLSIEIRPKLAIDRVLFMLSYALRPEHWPPIDFDFAPASGLLEAIIPGFLSQVRRAFSHGILQGYRAEDAALLTVRGRIRFDDQIRDRYGICPPIEVRFDDFTEDIEVNRIIKAALSRLAQLARLTDVTRRSLRAYRGSLERVALVEYSPALLPEITYDRLNQHYLPAVELGKLILRSTSFDLESGGLRATSMLFDMNRVFEDFVVIALREALGLGKQSFPQGARGRQFHLDRGQRIRLEPDISWWEGDRCQFVGDVKYKRVNAPGVKHPDLYQMLAYTVAADLPAGLLIYAGGEGESVTHEVRMLGKRIRVLPLDLSGSPQELLAQMDMLAEVVRRMRWQAEASVA